MSAPTKHGEPVVLTALLTTNVARAAHGASACVALIEEVLTLNHTDLETTMWLGDEEYHTTPQGPFPDSQMRVSVRPSAGYAALSYTNHDEPGTSIVNSYNPSSQPTGTYLIFNGDTGSVFPQSALIPIPVAREALLEWLETRSRPTCIEWQPFDRY